MKTGYFDWTDNNLDFFVMERRSENCRLVERKSLVIDEDITTEALQSLDAPPLDSVYLSLPLQFLSLRKLHFPFREDEKIRDTLAFELEGLLLGSTADYSIDYVKTGETGEGTDLLAVCVEKKRLHALIDVFAGAGLDPKIITASDLSLSEEGMEGFLKGEQADMKDREALAVREILHPSVNLRKRELAYMGDVEKTRKVLRLSATLCLLVLLVIGAYTVLRYTKAKNTHAALKAELNSIYQTAFPGERVIDPLRQFQANLTTLKARESALSGIPVLDILNRIAISNDRSLTMTEFTADGANLLIRGTAGSFEKVESLKDTFSSDFSDVRVLDSDATVDKRISFTIAMKEKNP